MDVLVADRVCRSYGRDKVLDGFSLTVGAGRIEALMGPSGSGKGLIVDDTKGKTNLSGLKLTYTPKKGTFKGSFKVTRWKVRARRPS